MTEPTLRSRARARAATSNGRAAAASVASSSPLVGAVLLFVIGLSIGRAVEDAPKPGGEQTIVRTLTPGTLPPVTRTVTVTTTP